MVQKVFYKYTIPVNKIYQEVLILFGLLLFIISPLVILIILRLLGANEIEKQLDPLLDLSFKFIAIIVLINLLYPVFLMRLITYPVRKWSLRIVKCPKCNNNISKSEYEFSNTALASLMASCDICKKVYFLETGFWNRTLKFNIEKINWLGESSGKIFEKLYFGVSYKVPLTVWFISLPFIFSSVILLLIFFILAVYLSFKFLNIKLNIKMSNIIILLLPLISAWFLLPILNKIKIFNKIEFIVLEKWILNNVKCPDCDGKFQTCEKDVKNKFHWDYKLYCEYCKKNRLLGFRGYNTRLIFLD
jgi:hypothetical protein